MNTKTLFVGISIFFSPPVIAQTIPKDVQVALQKNTCTACHKMEGKLVGPSFKEIAKKGKSVSQLVNLIKKPVPANWADYPPMAPMPNVAQADLQKIATWIKSLYAKK